MQELLTCVCIIVYNCHTQHSTEHLSITYTVIHMYKSIYFLHMVNNGSEIMSKNNTHGRHGGRTEAAQLPKQVKQTSKVWVFAEQRHWQFGAWRRRQVRCRNTAVRST